MGINKFVEDNEVSEFLEYGMKLNDMEFDSHKSFINAFLKLEKMMTYYGFKRVKSSFLKSDDSEHNWLQIIFMGKDEDNEKIKVELGFDRIGKSKYKGFLRFVSLH